MMKHEDPLKGPLPPCMHDIICMCITIIVSSLHVTLRDLRAIPAIIKTHAKSNEKMACHMIEKFKTYDDSRYTFHASSMYNHALLKRVLQGIYNLIKLDYDKKSINSENNWQN